MNNLAYKQGFAAGQAGLPTSACEWLAHSPTGVAWFVGHRDGRNERRLEIAIEKEQQRDTARSIHAQVSAT